MLIKILSFALLQSICVNSALYDRCLDSNHVAMTFDDGPNENTKELVNILDKEGVLGAFFINGIHVERNTKYTDFLKSMHATGHVIASHTLSHPALGKLNSFNVYRELYDNEFIMRRSLGIRPRYFRPPYFDYNDQIFDIAATNFGYDIIMSKVVVRDWEKENSVQETHQDY
ncbi:MAG: polysaccharide deacetylase family protein, partial [Oligoflexales bacterium]